MEYSLNEIICSFENEWKFEKAELLTIKDSEDDVFFGGKCFYAFNIPGLQYSVFIFPNGDNEKHRGETWIFLNAIGSNEKKIFIAEFSIFIESAGYLEDKNYIYERNIGWGNKICESSDFFDSKNKYFVNGEITIKVKGTFKTERPTISKVSTPISMQWKIKEEDLKAKIFDSNNVCTIFSDDVKVPSFANVKYYLSIILNESSDKLKEKEAFIYLQVDIGKERKVEAVFDFSVDSVCFNAGIHYFYESNIGKGFRLCSTSELFDPSKRFFVDGFLTIKLNGIFMKEKQRLVSMNCKNGFAPKSSLNKLDKDFSIIIDKKVIKVHKQVLSKASLVFAGMFESGMKESIENAMYISDFEFQIVEAAIKLCYSTNGPRSFVFEEMLLLFEFADKYRIQFIMDLVEDYFIEQLSPSNVVFLIKYSAPDSFNIKKLHQKCIEFLIKCFKESTPIYASDSLNEKLLASIFMNSLYFNVGTDSNAVMRD